MLSLVKGGVANFLKNCELEDEQYELLVNYKQAMPTTMEVPNVAGSSVGYRARPIKVSQAHLMEMSPKHA